MIWLLADEDFNGRIIRGLLRRVPELNLLTVSGAGLAGSIDPIIISWARSHNRVLLTHDVNTMIDAALDRVRTAEPMPGVVAVPQDLGIGAAISDLFLIVTYVEPQELEGQVWYLPL